MQFLFLKGGEVLQIQIPIYHFMEAKAGGQACGYVVSIVKT